MTENLASMMPSDQFTMMHHSQQSDSAATAAAVTSLTSELIHASFVAATQTSQAQQNTQYTNDSPSNGSCGLNTTGNSNNSNNATTKKSTLPTFQKCQYEMVAWDAEIAKEKDDRLDDFIRWSTALHQGLEILGYWSDMTDPASGFPSFSERGRDVYPDVEGCQLLLKYDFQNAGCCKVLLHPNWGSKIYPATFFTTAPLDALLKVIAQVEQEYHASKSHAA
ncbi:hypothetical protein BGX26_004286 [Mortierella sp. AD094]|nr:hypothetical protein BGX26_004286 [Mortierella sp. AD094]